MHREMLTYINQDPETKGLFLLDPVTGFGKTHEAIETIYQHVFCADKPLDGTILYVTPLLKNLNDVYEGLKRRVRNDKLFGARAIIIKSNFDCLADAFNALSERRFSESEIPKAIVDCKVYQQLKHSFPLYEKLLKEKAYEAAENVREEIASKLDSDFRQEIKAYFGKRTKNSNSKSKGNKKEEDIEERLRIEAFLKDESWVLRFYPHTNYWKYNVVLMSFAKCIRRISTPFDTREIIACFSSGNSVLILDEFDATKKVYLSELLKNRIYFDAIRYFTILYGRLKSHKFKSIDMQSIEFRALCRDADAIFRKYHLDCNYISSKDQESSYLPQKEKILFHDNYYFSPVNTNISGKYINAIHSPQKEINEIFYSKKAHSVSGNEEKMDLPSLLSRMNHFFGSLQSFINESANAYQENQNELRKRNKQEKQPYKEFTQEEAQSTIYYDFGLDPEFDQAFLKFLKDIPDRRKSYAHNSRFAWQQRVSDFTFYNKGFQYYAFKDDDRNNEITIFGFTAVNVTPESCLLRWCNAYKVIGLSATALTPSFCTNYNLEYLKQELVDRLIVLSEEKRAKFIQLLQERFRAYREPVNVTGRNVEVEIALKVVGQRKACDLKEWVLAWFPPKAHRAISMKYDALRAELQSETKDKQEYFLQRYVDVFEVMQYFFANQGVRSLLCLHMPKASERFSFSKDVFEKWFKDFQKIYAEPAAVLLTLDANDYAASKKRIEELVGGGEKVFVMAAYATVGTGQNFTFEIPENEREDVFCITECAPEDTRGKTKDFDAIFLGELTNQLVNEIGDETAELGALYEITEHYSDGNIDFREHVEAIGDVFSHAFPYRNQSVIRASRAIRIGNTATVLQAVGRITRTFCKKRQVHILTTDALLRQLDVSYLVEEQLSPEMAAIVAASKAKQLNFDETPLLRRELNLMSVHTAEFNDYLQKLTHGVWTPEKHDIYCRWNAWIIKNPTPKLNMLPQEYRWAYIQDLGGCGEYYYRFLQENGNYEISFEQSSDYKFTVNEAQSKLSLLMNYPGAREHFEEQGWATSFSRGDLVLNPVAFRNLYKGRLGEEGCKLVVTREFMLRGYTIQFQPIKDLAIFEKFDFELSSGVFVDAKNWNESFLKSEEAELKKIQEKMESTNAKIVFYINLSSEYGKIVIHRFSDEQKVYFVPRLLDSTGAVDHNIIEQLLEEMKRHGSCNLI